MGWKGESNRHSLSSRGIKTVHNTRNINHYELIGEDKNILKTNTIKFGQRAYQMGEFVGYVLAVGTAEQLIHEGYDVTGAMEDYVKTGGYGEYDSSEDALQQLTIAVGDRDINAKGKPYTKTGLYLFSNGGIDEVGE